MPEKQVIFNMQFMICGISLTLPPESPTSSPESPGPTTPREPQSSTDKPLASHQPPPKLSVYIASTLELVGVVQEVGVVYKFSSTLHSLFSQNPGIAPATCVIIIEQKAAW